MRSMIGTVTPPAGFSVSTPPPPQAVSLGVVDMGDGWTAEAFEDATTGIQYIEYWNASTGEMLWFASSLPGGGDALAVTEQRWGESTGGKWMWAGLAAGLGAVGGVVVQRARFPQYNAAVVAGIGAVVLGGVGYMAYGMMQKNGRGTAGIGARKSARRSTQRGGGGSSAQASSLHAEMQTILNWANAHGYPGFNTQDSVYGACNRAIYNAGQGSYAVLHGIGGTGNATYARTNYQEALSICASGQQFSNIAPLAAQSSRKAATRGIQGYETPSDLRRSGNLYGLGQDFNTPGDVKRYW